MLEQVTPPSEDDILSLLDVAAFKEAKRLSNAREDGFIASCILDAWSFLDGPEGRCRRAVLPQRWAFTRPGFTSYGWELPVHGARSIVSVTYYDRDNQPQTVDSGNYWLDDTRGTRRFYMPTSWAAQTVYDRHDAVRVVFDAGWPTALDVPRVFRRALLLLAAHYYDNREETFADNRVSTVSRRIEFGLDKLLEKYVVPLDFAGGQCALVG